MRYFIYWKVGITVLGLGMAFFIATIILTACSLALGGLWELTYTAGVLVVLGWLLLVANWWLRKLKC